MKNITSLILLFLWCVPAIADLNVKRVDGNIENDFRNQSLWKSVEMEVEVSLMGQPMVPPKPKSTETSSVRVSAIHDGKWAAFRLRWKDAEISESDRLATFSDAVAIQFPIKNNEAPPPPMMGGKDDPVHIFHWRYQYQVDAIKGKKTIDQIYPNMSLDMYPLDFRLKGNHQEATQEQKDSFVGGLAAGNPQSVPKSGVDEILAEGFGTSALMEARLAKGFGEWKNGEWTVIIARPLNYENESKLPVGKKSNIAFAVWQGGKKEIGAIKSLTMMWTPLSVSER